jgi:hypothetical protein
MGRANSRKSNSIHPRSSQLSTFRCKLSHVLKDGFNTIVARVVEMIRLGGCQKNLVYARSQQRA